MEQIIEIIKWVIPTGVLGSIVTWLFNRTSRQIKELRECYELTVQMNSDLRQSLSDETEEKKQLRRAVGRFERAVSRMFGCKHYSKCPVDLELKQNKEQRANIRGQSKHKGSRQSGDRGNIDKEDDTNSDIESLSIVDI